MDLITQSLRPEHRFAVKRVDTPDDIPFTCPQNFNLFSECFAAVAFTSFPNPGGNVTLDLTALANTGSAPQLPPGLDLTDPSSINFTALDPFFTDPPNATAIYPPTSLLNYTIRGDAGFGFIDVVHHTSDFEERILPLQWAIDSVCGYFLFRDSLDF